MTFFCRSLALFFVPLVFAGAAERDIVRTFPALPGCSLSIDTFRGSITVTEAETTVVRVAVHLEIGADTEAEADRMVAALELDLRADGSVISVTARDPEQMRPRMVWDERKQIEPTFRVTVPTSCNVNLKTRTGSIIVGNITGRLRAQAETGDVFFRRVGGHVDAITRTGNVVVSHCDGTLNAQTSHGTIRLGVVTGGCHVRNDSGDIDVMAAKSDIEAFAVAGSVSLDLPRDFNGTANVTTDGGRIIAAIDPAANCDVDAATSLFARVKNALSLRQASGRSGTRRLSGRLNRGGARVVLHASGGDIKLVQGDSPFE